MPSDDLAKFPIRLDSGLHKQLKSVLALKGKTIQGVVVQHLEQVVATSGAVLEGLPVPAPKVLIPSDLLPGLTEASIIDVKRNLQAAKAEIDSALSALEALTGKTNHDADKAAAAARSATAALEQETRAAQDLAAETTRSHGRGIDAAPGHKRIKGK
jgi:hypothetical protein